MATGQPFFPGSAIDSQLELIFRTLGTPTESSWPGVASYKSFEPFKIPCYKPESLVSSAPRYVDFWRTVLVKLTIFMFSQSIRLYSWTLDCFWISYVHQFFTAHSKLHKVLFLALSVTAERICTKFTRKTWSLSQTSFNVKVKEGQGHHGQKHAVHSYHPRQRWNGTCLLRITSRNSRLDHSVTARG